MGAIIKAPPRLRQKTSVEIGITLFAIIGPEEPMPRIPNNKKGISLPSGRAVCSWVFIALFAEQEPELSNHADGNKCNN